MSICIKLYTMILLCVYILNLLLVCHADVDILCSEELCSEQSNKEEYEDKVPDGCETNGVMLKSPSPCNCFKYCISYIEEGKVCSEGTPGSETVQNICGPGLRCENGICEKMTNTSCKKKQIEFDTNSDISEISWRPVCDSEGDFGPVHCIPNSICFCIEPTNGRRIFGEAVYTPEVAEEMNCSCSLINWKVANLIGKKNYFRCQIDGHYDELQCVDGECMCVDKTTGTPIGDTRAHVTTLKEGILPCFNKEIHPERQFEKSCQLEYSTKLDEIANWNQEGMEVLNIILPKCTPDGNYHRVQRARNGNGFKCVDPDGNLIGSYQSDTGEGDCNCAYTTWLMKKSNLLEFPACEKDGSFKSWQCYRDKCYCVDENGDQSSPYVNFNEVDKLECYPKSNI